MSESSEKFVYTTCPRCGSHLQTPAAEVGRQTTCPKCGHEMKPTATGPLRQSQVYIAPPEDDDEYAIREVERDDQADLSTEPSAESATVAEQVSDEVLTGQKQPSDAPRPTNCNPFVMPSERPKLPSYPMLQGVLSFFWHAGAIACWSGLSIGAMIVCGLFWRAIASGGLPILMNMQSSGGGWLQGGAAAIVFLLCGLAGLLASAVWIIIASSYLMAILHDSAAGNRAIVNWPEIIFTEMIGAGFYVVISLLIPVGIAYVIAMPLGGLFAIFWLVPLFIWFFFPIVLLSALESQTPLMPFSPMVWRSMVKCRGTWLLFYGETALMGFIVALALGVFVLLNLGTVGTAILAAVGVTVVMLYFRLLGRLVWVCDEYFRFEVDEDEDEDEPESKTDRDDSSKYEPNEIHPTPVDDF